MLILKLPVVVYKTAFSEESRKMTKDGGSGQLQADEEMFTESALMSIPAAVKEQNIRTTGTSVKHPTAKERKSVDEVMVIGTPDSSRVRQSRFFTESFESVLCHAAVIKNILSTPIAKGTIF